MNVIWGSEMKNKSEIILLIILVILIITNIIYFTFFYEQKIITEEKIISNEIELRSNNCTKTFSASLLSDYNLIINYKFNEGDDNSVVYELETDTISFDTLEQYNKFINNNSGLKEYECIDTFTENKTIICTKESNNTNTWYNRYYNYLIDKGFTCE